MSLWAPWKYFIWSLDGPARALPTVGLNIGCYVGGRDGSDVMGSSWRRCVCEVLSLVRFVTLLQFCRQRRHFSPSKHARTHSTVFFACAGRPSWPRSAGIVACASLLTTIVLSDFFFSFLKDNEQRHNRHGRVSSSWHCSSCTSSKKSVQFESRAASVDVKHMEAVSKLEEAQQHSRNAKKLELQFLNCR